MAEPCAHSAIWPLLLLAACSTPRPVAETTSFPAGSEKAVRAVRAALPGAVVTEVARSDDFGTGAGKGVPLSWNVKLRDHERDSTLMVTPEGAIVLLPRPIEDKDLPAAVRAAVSQECSGAKIRRLERQETGATLRYAALERTEIGYFAQLSKDSERRRLEFGADGKVLRSVDLGSSTEAGEQGEEAPPPAQPVDFREPAVEPDAARAVAAVRAVLPRMVFRGVEEVGFLDGMNEMSVLNYEVEFYLDGVAGEWNATPEGIVIRVPSPIGLETAPAAVRKALAVDAAWKVEKLVREETRAGLRFVALPQPKIGYLVEFEKDGKPQSLRFKPDGTKIVDVDPRALLGK